MRTIRDFDFKNKRVLVRCDFNVPLRSFSEGGEILGDFKIKKTLPTIDYLINAGASGIVLISHLARKSSLKPVAKRLEELLGREVKFAEPGYINLLENLRFNKGEENPPTGGDDNFAEELAKLGDIFINDAFAVCHRAHASIVGIPKFLPSGMGLLLEKEIKILSRLLENPEKPLVAIIGGAKAQTKVKIIEKLLKIADFVLVGGLLNKEITPTLKGRGSDRSVGEAKIIGAGEGLDIPEADLKIFKEKIAKAKTVFWNGPLGKTEDEQFAKGTKEIALAIIESGAFSVAGGGETVEFLNKENLIDKFSYVSTGGGAMMSFLSGDKLPGIEALK